MWLSDKEIEQLKKELATVYEDNFVQRQKLQDKSVTLEAQIQAKLEWLLRNNGKIRSSYLELMAAFDSGDVETVSHQLYRLGDLAPAVLSIAAVDPSGNRLRFIEWAKTAFAEPAQQRMIALKIDKALKTPLTPSFDEITATGKTGRVDYKEVELTLQKRVTGSYKEEMEKAIIDAKMQGIYKIEALEKHIRQKEQNSRIAISDALSGPAKETLMLACLIRMEEAIDAPADRAAIIFKNLLPFLNENYGVAETHEWLFGEEANGESRVKRLLARKDKSLHDPDHPLKIILDTISDDYRSAGILRGLADKTDDAIIARELEELAIKKAGDYLPVSTYRILNPYAGGAIVLGEDRIGILQRGATATYATKIKNSETFAAHLARLPGFWREDGRKEIINEAVITRVEIKDEKDGTVRLLVYCHDQLAAQMPMPRERAEGHLERLAQDDRFLRLGDGTLIDTSRAVHAWISSPKKDVFNYEIKYIQNGQIHKAGAYTLPEEAQTSLAQFARRLNVIYLNEKEIVDTAAIGNAWIEELADSPGQAKLKYVLQGAKEVYHSVLESGHAAAIIRDLARKAGHMAVMEAGKRETINPAACTLIYYDETKGALVYAVENTLAETKMSRDDGEKMLAAIEREVPGFIRHQRMGLLAPGKAERITYDGEEGALKYMVGATSWRSICSPEAGHRVIEWVARNPEFMRLTPQIYLRRDAVAMLGWDPGNERMYWCLSAGADEKLRARMTETEAKRILSGFELEGRTASLNRVAAKYGESEDRIVFSKSDPKQSADILPGVLPAPRNIDLEKKPVLPPAGSEKLPNNADLDDKHAPRPAASGDAPPPRPKNPDLSLPDVFNSRKDREEAARKPAAEKSSEDAPAPAAAPRLTDLKI